MNLYSKITDKLQGFINRRIAQVPNGFVDSCCKSFAVSFAMSSIFAKEDRLRAGFLGRAVSILAVSVDALMRRLIVFISTHCTNNYFSDSTEAAIWTDTTKLSFAMTLYLTQAFKWHVNIKGSCRTTVPLYLYSMNRIANSPCFSIMWKV
jgi:hypothetical protein